MADDFFFVSWPNQFDTPPDARVARNLPDQPHHNTLTLQPSKVYVYWSSPNLIAPAGQWFLHAASVKGRDRDFDPIKQTEEWEHFPIADDGLTDFEFSADRTYVFYFTPQQASVNELKTRNIPWPVHVYRPDDQPEIIRILFPAQPFDADQHGMEYAEEFDLSRSIGTPRVFASDEHLSLADDAQRLVDYYALAGLIEGGALIRTQEAAVSSWDIRVPNPKADAARPYGDDLFLSGATLSYHWRYIFPDPLADSSGSPWTEKSLKAAILEGKAVALSLGQIVMLAGDFYAKFEDMKQESPREPANFIKGAKEQKKLACMVVDVVCFSRVPPGKQSKADLNFMEKVSQSKEAKPKEVNWDKIQGIVEGIGKMRGPTNFSEMHALSQLAQLEANRLVPEGQRMPWIKPNEVRDCFKSHGMTDQEIDRLGSSDSFAEVFNAAITNGQYAALALENYPHFSPDNWTEFRKYHEAALRAIETQIKDPKKRHPIPAEAVAQTAFGLHFLTDAFSAGHMRVPRRSLGLNGALAAKVMHDIDGKFGLQVKDGFGSEWRAFGDGFLRQVKLDPTQQQILDKIKAANGSGQAGVSMNADTNWEKAKAATCAAFKQLHYHAQRGWELPPPPDHHKHHHKPHRVSPMQAVLTANRDVNQLKWDEHAKVPISDQASLDAMIKEEIPLRLLFLKKYLPVCNPSGDSLLRNHPALFDSQGQLNRDADGKKAYKVDDPWWTKRILKLTWHGIKNPIEKDFTAFYYLAKYGKGASAEGWVTQDENRVVQILDAMK